MNKYEKRIESILKGFRLSQYREGSCGSFVEFWAIEDVDRPLHTKLSLEHLNQIAKLLNTYNMIVTGGNIGIDDTDENWEQAVYVCATLATPQQVTE